LPAASQPLLTWKYTQFNTHRRDFDPGALRLDTDPPETAPEIPRFAGLHQEAAVRWAAVMKKAQLADPDMVIPAAKRAEYEESFARFAKVFPDAFYIKERGKFFPDDSSDSGGLSAGYHSVMGNWRDDLPLQELILTKGQEGTDRLWTELTSTPSTPPARSFSITSTRVVKCRRAESYVRLGRKSPTRP
jgi:hypothetical protein